MDKKTIWELNRDSLDEYRAKGKLPFVVVLDNVRSLNNIGSIFRTSDAFMVERLMLCGITATPPSPEIHKTALGAEESVAWTYWSDTKECIDHLRNNEYTICCLEQVKESVRLQDFKPGPNKKYAIVVGHEVNGVNQKIVDMADSCIEIPQYGTKHSLNVAVSCGIAIWHFFTAMHR